MTEKILIVHQGALGDVILTFPAITALKKYFREIHILCQNSLGKLACHLGLTDKHFPIESALFSSLYSDLHAESVHPQVLEILRHYDEIILFSFSLRLWQSVRGITKKNITLIPPRPEVGENIHVSEHIFSEIVRCGFLGTDDLLPIPQDLRHENHDPSKILIHPGSGSRRKNWHLRNFVRVHDMLKEQGKNPEFVLGPAEEYLSEKLRYIGSSEMMIHRNSDLTEIVPLLRNAGGFIGNDSGLTHLAAFSGLPTTAIFGPSDPLRWKPVGLAVKFIRATTVCEPCFETNPNNCDKPECFENVRPEEVIRAILFLTPPDK